MSDDPEITDPRNPHRRRDVDVVAELDRWLDNSNDRTTAIERRVVLRARHEIVALRATKVLPGWTYAIRQTRDEALEEAAQKAEHYEAPIWSAMIAAAIRALKGTAR